MRSQKTTLMALLCREVRRALEDPYWVLAYMCGSSAGMSAGERWVGVGCAEVSDRWGQSRWNVSG